MKYEHQINWANAYDNNLDILISRLVQNGGIHLLSTRTYYFACIVTCPNSEEIWSQIKSNHLKQLYDISISRVLCLGFFYLRQACFYSSCSCHLYASLVAVFYCHRCVCVFIFFVHTKRSIFLIVLNPPFYFSSSISLNFFHSKKLKGFSWNIIDLKKIEEI